ncbi:hypothetical protein CEXT_136821 [Caerostris extrusa]|uniref:Uncharacterized protein n=1 Tax=Caerostris extrusa TaxID=172846 RepID=A0AAV4PLW1_CAEEX|nr:hypothetical protein CEXT_136821 [Caerostris extrusa]
MIVVDIRKFHQGRLKIKLPYTEKKNNKLAVSNTCCNTSVIRAVYSVIDSANLWSQHSPSPCRPNHFQRVVSTSHQQSGGSHKTLCTPDFSHFAPGKGSEAFPVFPGPVHEHFWSELAFGDLFATLHGLSVTGSLRWRRFFFCCCHFFVASSGPGVRSSLARLPNLCSATLCWVLVQLFGRRDHETEENHAAIVRSRATMGQVVNNTQESRCTEAF